MGNSSTTSGKYRRMGGGIDKCIGNRKVRTITLSLIMIGFVAMGLSYFYDQKDLWSKLNVELPLIGDTCSSCKDAGTAYTIIIIGSWTILVSSVLAIFLFFVNCDDNVGRITGAGLIIGGLMYIVGAIWFISLYNDMYDWIKDLPADTKDRYNAMLASWFGEALLPSTTAILLGSDVFVQMFDNETHRLVSNLMNLLLVSGLTGPVYYMLSEDQDVSLFVTQAAGTYPINSDSYPWIATGYMVVFGACAVYILCSCFDCKDTKVFRLLLSLALIVGGILTSVGYYIYAGEFTSQNSDDPTNKTWYYIGYTICIGGGCIVWALDIGLDDIR